MTSKILFSLKKKKKNHPPLSTNLRTGHINIMSLSHFIKKEKNEKIGHLLVLAHLKLRARFKAEKG